MSADRNKSVSSTQRATRKVAYRLAVMMRMTMRQAAIDKPILMAVSVVNTKYCS